MSTTHAILDNLTSLYDGIREKQFSGLFFLDLKKAFDTVSHNILLSKLDYYGIRGMTLKLMNSYLQRKQYVLINNIESKLQSNNYGVPQGSTLGPLLFLLSYYSCRLFTIITILVDCLRLSIITILFPYALDHLLVRM